MPRKRAYRWRPRPHRKRPDKTAAKTGWVISELSRLTHVPVRTLRHYAALKLIAPIARRGRDTRYARRELLRVLGIVRLRAETGEGLSAIKRKLDAFDELGLEAWLRSAPMLPKLSAALALADSGTAASVQVARVAWGAAAESLEPQALASTPPATPWKRIVLLPGLELLVSADASPVVQRAAQTICEECLGARRGDVQQDC